VLERQRQAAAHQLDPLLELAALGARDSLQAERPRPQVGPLGATGLLSGEMGELDGVAVAAGALQVARRDQPLRGGLSGQSVGGERLGGHAPRCERPLVERIDAIRPLTIAFSAAYLALSLRFWFYVPAIITGTATACFTIATVLSA
jgi:hypothetical protein